MSLLSGSARLTGSSHCDGQHSEVRAEMYDIMDDYLVVLTLAEEVRA